MADGADTERFHFENASHLGATGHQGCARHVDRRPPRSPAPRATAHAGSDDDRPTVIATMSIWADVVDQLDCTDTFTVESLVPAGGDPHSFEPSMQDRDHLGDAALVDHERRRPGGGPGRHDRRRRRRRRHPRVHGHRARDDHDARRRWRRHHDDDDDDDHHHDSGVDPHVWLDPTLVIEAMPALADALAAAGGDATDIEQCATDLTASLTTLDSDITTLVDTLPAERRVLVTNHDALGYFARRYGFEILGSVLPSTSTLVAASPGELDDLAAAIEAADVPAIFAEALETTDDATALADRLGVGVVMLYTDSLGPEDSDAATYQDMMRHDADAIVGALAG